MVCSLGFSISAVHYLFSDVPFVFVEIIPCLFDLVVFQFFPLDLLLVVTPMNAPYIDRSPGYRC